MQVFVALSDIFVVCWPMRHLEKRMIGQYKTLWGSFLGVSTVLGGEDRVVCVMYNVAFYDGI